MTFPSLDDVIKLVIFYSIFTKMITFEVFFSPEEVISYKFNGIPS